MATALAYGLALAVASVVDPFIIGPIQVKLNSIVRIPHARPFNSEQSFIATYMIKGWLGVTSRPPSFRASIAAIREQHHYHKTNYERDLSASIASEIEGASSNKPSFMSSVDETPQAVRRKDLARSISINTAALYPFS